MEDKEHASCLIFSEYSHSDLNRVYGQLPLVSDIVGHEGVGTVVQGTAAIGCIGLYFQTLTRFHSWVRGSVSFAFQESWIRVSNAY